MEHNFTIEQLRDLCVTTAEINYSTDAADSLNFDLLTEAYSILNINANDRITVTAGENIVFSGIVPTGPRFSARAGENEIASISAYSDFYLLDRTSFARLAEDGTPLYPRALSKTTTLSTFTNAIFDYAAEWDGSLINSDFSCTIAKIIPTPQGNGATPCGQLIRDALKWVPDSIVCQRYSADGHSITLTTSAAFETLELPETALLTSIQLTPRNDLIPPVCALIGATHAVYPAGGDVREHGAFVFTVPATENTAAPSAGTAAASQKMVIKGVPVPERYAFRNHAAEYDFSAITVNSNAYKFFKTCFPNYTDFLPYAKIGSAFIFVTPKDALVYDDTSADEETQKPPANYSIPPWTAGSGGMYVLTEGSFTASARASKNLRGLSWCKAKITVMIAVPRSGLSQDLIAKAPELFPGMVKIDGEKYGFARLTLDCVLINRAKRIFDPATNAPCSTDAEYTTDTTDDLTLYDYRAAMQNYYNSSRTLYHEGTITLIDDNSLNPATLTGRALTIAGKRAEWQTMNTVIRNVAWNLATKTLALSVGSRASLSFNEFLERRRMNKRTADTAAQNLAAAFDVLDTEATAEAENEMTVSPSITPGMAPSIRGKARKMGTLYSQIIDNDNDTQTLKWWLAGGTLKKGNQTFVVEDTDQQITNGAPNGVAWVYGKRVKVRFIYDSARNVINYDIYQ